VTRKCFEVYTHMNPKQFQMTLKCIIWSCEHIQADVCDTGLETLIDLLKHIGQDRNRATDFYKNFAHVIFEKLLGIMTDNMHKAAMPAIVKVLAKMCSDVQSPQVTSKMFNEPNCNSNGEFVAKKLSTYLIRRFPNLTPNVVKPFLLGLFDLSSRYEQANNPSDSRTLEEKLTVHCGDFLVQLKQLHQRQEEHMNGTPNGL